MGAGAGLEPATFSLWGWRATTCSTPHGDPKENRTPAFAVKGRRLSRLTMGPDFKTCCRRSCHSIPVFWYYCRQTILTSQLAIDFFLVPPRPAFFASQGIEPLNKFCHRTTQHLSLGSEHTYFSNTFNHNGLSKTLWWPVRESNPRLRRERPVSWPLD